MFNFSIIVTLRCLRQTKKLETLCTNLVSRPWRRKAPETRLTLHCKTKRQVLFSSIVKSGHTAEVDTATIQSTDQSTNQSINQNDRGVRLTSESQSVLFSNYHSFIHFRARNLKETSIATFKEIMVAKVKIVMTKPEFLVAKKKCFSHIGDRIGRNLGPCIFCVLFPRHSSRQHNYNEGKKRLIVSSRSGWSVSFSVSQSFVCSPVLDSLLLHTLNKDSSKLCDRDLLGKC